MNRHPSSLHGAVEAEGTARWHGMPPSAEITLPANGFAVFACDR